MKQFLVFKMNLDIVDPKKGNKGKNWACVFSYKRHFRIRSSPWYRGLFTRRQRTGKFKQKTYNRSH